MNKLLSRPEIIVFISVLPILFMIFVEHDELLVLFLIELGFMGVIGLMYVVTVIVAIAIVDLIGKILRRCKYGRQKDSSGPRG